MAIALVVSVLLGACRVGPPPAPPPADCSRSAPPGAATFDSASVGRLAGSYTLISVTTARGYGGGVDRGRLRLSANDTLARFYVGTIRGDYRRSGDRPLAGAYEAPGRRYRDTAVVGGGVLFVGCRECMDASPTHYRIEAAGPAGFWGRWENYQTGGIVAVDARGRRLSNPSGYFCALRVSP